MVKLVKLKLLYVEDFLELCKYVIKAYVKEQFKTDLSLDNIKVLWTNNDPGYSDYIAILRDFSFDKDIYFECFLNQLGEMLEISAFSPEDSIYHVDVNSSKREKGTLDYFTTSLTEQPSKAGCFTVKDSTSSSHSSKKKSKSKNKEKK